MLDDQIVQGNLANQRIAEGTSVYDVNGDKVGEVNNRGLQRNALMVQKGLLFPRTCSSHSPRFAARMPTAST